MQTAHFSYIEGANCATFNRAVINVHGGPSRTKNDYRFIIFDYP